LGAREGFGLLLFADTRAGARGEDVGGRCAGGGRGWRGDFFQRFVCVNVDWLGAASGAGVRGLVWRGGELDRTLSGHDMGEKEAVVEGQM